MRWPFPSREPTPSEYAVLVWFASVVFIILGIVALAIGLRAPAQKHDAAVVLEYKGAWCLAIGFGILGLYWVYRRFKDY
jgi:hypothetical protein